MTGVCVRADKNKHDSELSRVSQRSRDAWCPIPQVFTNEPARARAALNAVSAAAEPKLASLHLRLVHLKFRGLLLLGIKQGGVLALADAALLDAAKGQQQDTDTKGNQGADDDAGLGACGQRLPVVADARRLLDFFQNL